MIKRTFKQVGRVGNIIINECTGNPPFKDEKFTYSIDDQMSNAYYECADSAMLGALGRKYLGHNSQFDEFAWKMLKEIK